MLLIASRVLTSSLAFASTAVNSLAANPAIDLIHRSKIAKLHTALSQMAEGKEVRISMYWSIINNRDLITGTHTYMFRPDRISRDVTSFLLSKSKLRRNGTA